MDEQRNDSWDQTVLEHNTINEKDIVDRWALLGHNKAVANSNLQDQINSQYLRWADDAHSVANLVANNAAVLANRANNNALTFDGLMFAGEVDTTAQGKMASDLARSVASEAVNQALAMTAQTSPAAQGTTGVAQGGMQLGGGVATTAILAQIAKLAEAVNVLYVKVLNEETTGEKPA